MRFEREVNIYGDEVILKRFTANETSISVIQGEISAIISESELVELIDSSVTMYSKLASAIMDIDSLTINFSDLTTKYNTVSGQYTALDSKVAQYKASVDGLSANVSQISQNLENNYSTTTAMNAAIKASVDGLSSTVSKTYATTTQLNTAKSDAISTAKSYTDSAKSSALTTAKGYADDAEAAANANTANRLKSYSTTAQMNSAIKQKADEISTSVSATYATKTSVTTAQNNAVSTAKDYTDSAKASALTTAKGYADAAENAANSNTENLLKNYSTTVQMNSAITQKANEISAEVSSLESTLYNNYSTTTSMNSAIDLKINQFSTSVSETYATKSQLNNYSTTAQMNSAINQKANEINASVSATYATKSALNTANGKIDDLEEWKSEASLKITDSAIISTVISSSSYENSVESLIEQNADSIRLKADRISWESTYSSMTSTGTLTCRNATIEGTIHSDNGDDEIYMQYARLNFIKDGVDIGYIGTNSRVEDPTVRGLVFDLEDEGDYMAWAAKRSETSDTYTIRWVYSKATFEEFNYNTLNAGCSIDVHNYYLARAYLRQCRIETGGIVAVQGYSPSNGTYNVVTSISDNGDGTISWTYGKVTIREGLITGWPT